MPLLWRMGAAAFVCAATLTVPAVFAQSPDDARRQLERVREDLSRGAARRDALRQSEEELGAAVSDLRAALTGTAATLQMHEADLTALERARAAQTRALAAGQETLLRERASLAQVLSVLAGLPPDPARFALLGPGAPVENLRRTLLLRAAVPAMEARLSRLRATLESQARIRGALAAREDEIALASDRLQAERDRMNALLARRRAAQAETRAARAATEESLAAMAAQAEDLRALIQRLEDEAARAAPRPSGGPPLQPFPESGALQPPVAGDLALRYGQDMGYGQIARGVRLRARPGAQVVAPHDGVVTFAGPFRRHGVILIIEHRGGYHTVLSGVGRLDTAAGHTVLRGEPLATMPVDGGGDGDGSPALYLEVRRDGQPVNPLRWLPNLS